MLLTGYPWLLSVSSGYLVVTYGYLNFTTGYFSLLLVASGYFWLLLVPRFSNNASPLLLSKSLWKCVSTISFKKYKWEVVLVAIYLLNYVSSKSIFSKWHLTLSWVRFLSNKLEFLVSCNIKITRTSLLLLCVLICLFIKA